MPHIGKFLSSFGCLALMASVLLCSCSHREKVARATPVVLPAEPVTGTNVLNPAKTRGVTPASLEAPLIATTEPYHTPRLTPQQLPTKEEQIVAMVNSGTLVESRRGVMLFARTKPVKKTSSSMYEDAILLGKVRRSLSSVRLPGDFPILATVADGVASLKMDGERNAEISAKAIDAVLKTSGIAAVEVRLVASARL